MTSNTYFYTYSTVAQTLAGAFGFLLAVVLYRLQGLGSSLRNNAAQLRDRLPEHLDLKEDWINRGRWSKFVELADNQGFPAAMDGAARTRAENVLRQFKDELGQLEAIRFSLKVSLVPTALILQACFLLIPLGELIQPCSLLANFCLGTVVIVAVFTVGSYLYLIREVVR